MKFIDLFAGIGGFHLGMEQAGHECVGWVEWDKFARKSYQAIHDVKGVWNASDIRTVRSTEIPRADCWCFGFPCQDISVAGKQGGFTSGRRSSLFFTVTGLLRGIQKEDRPAYLLIENVKNLLSINHGWDFAKLQVELDEIGYDVEWDVLDSSQVVPQHRERVFIVGHLRGRRTRKVFPIIRKGGKTNTAIKLDDNGHKDYQFKPLDIVPTLRSQAHGNEPKVVIPVSSPDVLNKNQNGRRFKNNGDPEFTLTARDRHGILTNNMKIREPTPERIKSAKNGSDSQEPKVMVREVTKKGFDIAKAGDTINLAHPNSKTRRGRVGHGIANTMTTSNSMATLTSDLRIRKLTPLECWRLQGFPDWAFNRARQAGLSDSQLYKQAGNSVTVPVIKAIAEIMELT